MAEAGHDSTLRRLGWRLVAPAIGSRWGGRVSEQIVKIAMRGIGINVGHHVDDSGESWFIPRLLAACPRAVCADVGANVGHYAKLLHRSGAARVFAFEAVPSTYAELVRALANLDDVVPVQAAVGEKTGPVDIQVPAHDKSTLASRDLHAAGLDTGAFVSHRVEMTTLDAFSDARKVAIDFIKVDVEGFELEVLAGAHGLLSSGGVAAVQLEFNKHHLVRRQHVGDFAAALPGYRLFRLTPRSLFPIREGHYLTTIYGFQNLVALHEGRRDLLRSFGH